MSKRFLRLLPCASLHCVFSFTLLNCIHSCIFDFPSFGYPLIGCPLDGRLTLAAFVIHQPHLSLDEMNEVIEFRCMLRTCSRKSSTGIDGASLGCGKIDPCDPQSSSVRQKAEAAGVKLQETRFGGPTAQRG